MASGFGTYDSAGTHIGGYTSYAVTAVVSQSVNTSNRTVTVSVTAYASYIRDSGGNWTVSQGTNFWSTSHSDSYMTVNLDGTTGSITGNIGVASSKSQTVTTGTFCSVPNGKAQAKNGYQISKTVSKTYSYNASGSAITKNWSIKLHAYESEHGYGWHDVDFSGTFTTDSIPSTAVAPSGANAVLNSTTYNSVNMTSSVQSWGSGYSGDPNLECIIINPAATTSTLTSYGRFLKRTSTTGKTYTASVSNANADATYGGGYTLKGATPFRVACWASTSVGEAHYVNPTTMYTQPAPLQSITKSETAAANGVSSVITVTGGNSSNNSSNSVTTQIRYSTDGGSTWTSWQNIGTGTAWTAKSTTITVPYGSSVKIKARQSYQNKYSDEKELSYTAMAAVAPVSPSVTVTGKTWDSVSLTGSISNYGTPSNNNDRRINIGIATSASTSATSMEVKNYRTTSANVIVDETSDKVKGGFDIKGMMTVYPYAWATNTYATSYVFGNAEVLPPAPSLLSYVRPEPGTPIPYVIVMNGDLTNNDTNYQAGQLTRTLRYRINDGPWVYVDNDSIVPLDITTQQSLFIPAGSSVRVEGWMTYKGVQSEITVLNIYNSNSPVHIYGSVNGVSEDTVKWYGSLNGRSVKFVRIYGSQDGVARKVFEDAS